jgi:NAD(P)-dependent dehydrogenase (short-subunit alcohol dehydrogenase family)
MLAGVGSVLPMADPSEHDRTALVTGATSGIGLATVLELARRGFRTVGTARSSAKADVVHRAADAAGVDVETVLMDVDDAGRCREVLDGLDLYALVNNAGYAVTGAVEDVDDADARQLLETMVVAPMRLSRLALPGMRARGGGRIVNVSSIAGLVSAPLSGWYTGAKHALEALSDSLRMEVAGDGVKVVLVEPGGFKTGIWEELRRDVDRLEAEGSRLAPAYARMLRMQRLLEPTMGRPEHCARVIVDAVEARHPNGRYLVGLDAQAIHLSSRFTPPFVRDRVLRLALGI